MKANKIPEKIYLCTDENDVHYYTEGIPFEREYIEYISTDAFMEKAKSWFIQQHIGMWNSFKNYIKENKL